MTFQTFEYQVFNSNGQPINFSQVIDLQAFEQFLQTHWDNRNFLNLSNPNRSTQQYLEFLRHGHLKATDYIGTIYFQNHTFHIGPKLFKQESTANQPSQNIEQETIKLIAKLLSESDVKVLPYFAMAVSQLGNLNLIEFLTFIYGKLLQNQLQHQPFIQYEDRQFIENQVRGKIMWKAYLEGSISRAQLQNIPFETQTFEKNNLFNQIIKRCLTLLLTMAKDQGNLLTIRTLLHGLVDVDDSHVTYRDCNQIFLTSKYQHYTPILSLSRMILFNQAINMNTGNQRGFCFLFQTSKLYEQYLSEIIKKSFAPPVVVFLQTKDRYLGKWYQYHQFIHQAFKTKPDVIIQYPQESIIVDCKYKTLPLGLIHEQDIDHADLYQMISYGIIHQSNRLWLLYPALKDEVLPKEPSQISIDQTNMTLAFIKVPILDYDSSSLIEFFKSKISFNP